MRMDDDVRVGRERHFIFRESSVYHYPDKMLSALSRVAGQAYTKQNVSGRWVAENLNVSTQKGCNDNGQRSAFRGRCNATMLNILSSAAPLQLVE